MVNVAWLAVSLGAGMLIASGVWTIALWPEETWAIVLGIVLGLAGVGAVHVAISEMRRGTPIEDCGIGVVDPDPETLDAAALLAELEESEKASALKARTQKADDRAYDFPELFEDYHPSAKPAIEELREAWFREQGRKRLAEAVERARAEKEARGSADVKIDPRPYLSRPADERQQMIHVLEDPTINEMREKLALAPLPEELGGRFLRDVASGSVASFEVEE